MYEKRTLLSVLFIVRHFHTVSISAMAAAITPKNTAPIKSAAHNAPKTKPLRSFFDMAFSGDAALSSSAFLFFKSLGTSIG